MQSYSRKAHAVASNDCQGVWRDWACREWEQATQTDKFVVEIVGWY